MKTRNLGIELDQNADFNAVIGVFGQGGPIDITGYSFLSQMMESTDPTGPVVAQFNFTVMNQLTNKGQVLMNLPATSSDESNIDTSVATALTKRRQTTPYVFDVKMKDTNGTITRIIQGLVYVSPEATQEGF